MVDEHFIRKRLTALREDIGVSESQMSLDLGHSRSYIQSIESGRSLPSMSEFLSICDYLDITPGEFFTEDNDNSYSRTMRNINRSVSQIEEDDLKRIVSPLLERLKKS